METVLKDTLMNRINALAFALFETVLYLDGHPTDSNALAYFKDTKAELDRAKAEYEKNYGPLTSDSGAGMQNASEWLWVTQPWPWQRGEDHMMRGK